MNIRSATAITGLLLISASVAAQTQTWRVIAANNNTIATPGFTPPVAPFFFKFSLFDGGQQVVLAQTSTSSVEGRYVRRQGVFTRYATADSAGVLGPNRSGAEANHVFRSFVFGDDALGGENNVAFAGKAGAPGAATGGLPNASWRYNGTQNVEFARALVDNQFGPGLGAGWFFADEGMNLYPQGDGSILIYTNITSPVNFTRRGVVKNTAAGGNVPCAQIGATAANVSPNIGTANPFQSISSVVTLEGNRTYMAAATQIGSPESGVWEICNGAPVARLLTARTGSFAPNVGIAGATFVQIYTNVRSGGNGDLVYGAQYRESPTSFPVGFFRTSAAGNNLIAKRDDSSVALGPNWLGSSFNAFEYESLTTAGAHVAFEASVTTPQSTNVNGIFRIRPGGNPEPVTLAGILAFGPAPGQTFARYDRWTLLSNGDIVADCAVNNGISGLYRFRIGQPPQLIMGAGTVVPVQTTSGLVQATVGTYAVPVVDGDSMFSSFSWSGNESWAGTDGTLLISANLNVGGTTVNTLLTYSIDVGAFLRDGFE